MHLTIPAAAFSATFPFHVALDREMRVVQYGPGLKRICPALEADVALGRFFQIERPAAVDGFDAVVANQAQLFVLAEPTGRFRLRGQMLHLPEEDKLLFLCSPWVADVGDARELGLTLEDFPLHDSTVQLLDLLQLQIATSADLRKLADKLKNSEASLRQAHDRLAAQFAELQRSQALAASILETAPDAIITIDEVGTVELANPAAEGLFGYLPGELVGQNVSRLMGPCDSAMHGAHLQRYLRTREPHVIGTGRTVVGKRKDGSDVPVHLSVGYMGGGDRPKFTGILHDISEQRQAEKAREEALAVLHSALEATADGLLVTDLAGSVVRVNRSFLEMWRIPGELAEEMNAGRFRSCVLPHLIDPDAFSQRADWLYAHPEEDSHEIVRLRDGRVYEGYSRPHRLSGKIIGRVWSYRDVSEQWRSQEALRLSEERYRIVAETASDGVLTIDDQSRILFANSALARIFGYSREELTGRGVTELMPDSQRQLHQQALERYIETGVRSTNWDAVQVSGRRRDGSEVPVELSFGESVVEGRRWFTGVVRDITERRKHQLALEESEQRYRSVVDQIKEAVFQTDGEGRWTFLNPAWVEIMGYSIEESLGEVFLNYVHPEDRQRNLDAFQPLMERKKEYCRHTVRYVRRDGGIRWMEVFARLTLDGSGSSVGTAGTLMDVTRRTEVEAELQSAKEAAEAASHAKTQFLGNVSHEIRTPLNAVVGMTELLRGTALTPVQRDYADTIWASSESLLHLINDLLDVSKIEAGQADIDAVDFYPGKVCEEAVEILKDRARRQGLDLQCVITPALPPRVVGDPNRIRQILLNLMGNAVKFTRQGYIALRLDWRMSPAPNAVELVFSVEDTGPGISPADRERIFEKFVQLDENPVSAGAGLGLNISRNLAAAMGGELGLDSEVGRGTRFHFRLTLPQAEVTTDRMRRVIDYWQGRDAAVFSGPAQYPFLRDILGSFGFRVASVADEEAAAEGEFDLALVCLACDWSPTGPLAGRIQLGDEPVIAIRPAGTEIPRWLVGRSDLHLIDTPPMASQLLRVLEAAAFGQAEADERADESEAGSVPPGAGVEILLVEDNSYNRKLTCQILQSKGYRVRVATNGAEAVEMLAEYQFDLVLMDIQMPVMDGFEATARLRAREQEERRPRTPVVAFTAHAVQEYRQQAFVAGMDEYLTKPVRAEHLLATVRRRIDPRAVVLIVDDSPENRILVSRFLDDQPGLAAIAVDSGEQALRTIRSRRISVVLLDISMPGMSGYETVAKIRQIPGRENLPVIAMTGFSGSEARRSAAEAGCTDYIEKPLRRAAVLEVLQRQLGAAPAKKAASHPPIQEPAVGVVQVDPGISDLVDEFLDTSRRDSVRLLAHVNERDFRAAAEIGHRLKGTGGAFGFTDLTDIGRDIESAAHERRLDALEDSALRLRLYLAGIRWEVRR